MVRDEHHHRVAVEPELVEAVHEHAQPAVGHRHLARVEGLHPLDEHLAVVPVQVAADRRVVRPGRLRAVIVGVAVHVDVLARRRPGLVRLERVDDDAERALAHRRLEHARAVAEHARGERLGLVVRVAAVGEVAAHPVAGVGVLDLGRQPVAQLGLRHTRRGTADLAAAPDEAVEAAPERAPRRREPERRVVGDVGGPVAGPAQGAREGGADVGDRGPARLRQQARIGMPAAERKHAPAAQDRAAGRHRRHRLGVEAREAEPLAGERVDVGRARPLAERVVGAQRVDDDHDHVGPVRSLAEGEPVEPRQRAGGGARRLQESAGAWCASPRTSPISPPVAVKYGSQGLPPRTGTATAGRLRAQQRGRRIRPPDLLDVGGRADGGAARRPPAPRSRAGPTTPAAIT